MTDYQLMEPLSEQEYEELKKDIALRGVLVPIEFDENGNILDGHHRIQAWRELKAEGLDLPDYARVVRDFREKSEAEKRNHIRALNLCRRHLTKEQKSKLWEQMRADGMTYEAIAEATGASKSDVGRSTFPNGKVPEKIIGKDGKARPPKYKKRKPKPPEFVSGVQAKNTREQNRAQDAIARTDGLSDKLFDVSQVETIARQQEREEEQKKGAEISSLEGTSLVDLRLGDCFSIMPQMEDESVDFIFTDPPYNTDSISLYGELAEHAFRILKPGGSLMVYAGQYAVPEILPLMSKHLRYWWMVALSHEGNKARQFGWGVIVQWKPILWYVKGDRREKNLVSDTPPTSVPDKKFHAWAQDTLEASYYIEQLTHPEELVLDPFAGSGTTCLAAALLGRKTIGIEIDEGSYAGALKRINEHFSRSQDS